MIHERGVIAQLHLLDVGRMSILVSLRTADDAHRHTVTTVFAGNIGFHENEAILLRSQNHLDLVATDQILKTVHFVGDRDSIEFVRSVSHQVHLVRVLGGLLDAENSITVRRLSTGIIAVLTHAVRTEQVGVSVGGLGPRHGVCEAVSFLRIYCLEADELFLSRSQVSYDYVVAFSVNLGGSTTFNE